MVRFSQARSLPVLLMVFSLLHQPSSADIRAKLWADLIRALNNYRFECGVQREARHARPTRILNGDDVLEEGKWPWMAYLYADAEGGVVDGFKCGATLIDTEWVLTAAHCIEHFSQPELYTVRLGERDIGDISGIEQNYAVSKIVMHHDFEDAHYQNDVALLKLSDQVIFSEYIRPVCLPPNGFATDHDFDSSAMTGKNCTALGWGQTETKLKSDILQSVTMSVMPRSLCKEATKFSSVQYQSVITDSSPQFCAHGIDVGGDTCDGDSGGPLVCEQDNRYFLHGVTSYGPIDEDENPLCGELYPSIYGQTMAEEGRVVRGEEGRGRGRLQKPDPNVVGLSALIVALQKPRTYVGSDINGSTML